jgi:phosphonoacetaldehyde hydrolase
MRFHYQRSSIAVPIQAVILDWAGTTVDFGSLGAGGGLCAQLFAEEGGRRSASPRRADRWATEKREHIRQLVPVAGDIASRWRERHGESAG